MPDRRGINVPLSKGLIGCRIRRRRREKDDFDVTIREE
jgi:hypothetical protein